VNEKKIWWRRVFIYLGFFVTGVIFAYFSIIKIKFSNNFPFFEINSVSQNNNEPFVYGYNILEGLAGLATIIAVIIAWRELSKFVIEKTQFEPELTFYSIPVWQKIVEKNDYLATSVEFPTEKISLSENVKREIYDISKHNQDGIFGIVNSGSDSANNVIIEIIQPKILENNEDYKNGDTVGETSKYTIHPKYAMFIGKDTDYYKKIDFKKSFAIKISYKTGNTKTNYIKIYKARVTLFVREDGTQGSYINDFVLLD